MCPRFQPLWPFSSQYLVTFVLLLPLAVAKKTKGNTDEKPVKAQLQLWGDQE